MKNIQHIIVATDFSNAADLAVMRAAQLAKNLSAGLHLVHVVHPLDLYAGSELSFDFQMHYQQVQQEHIKTQLESLAIKIGEQFAIKVHHCTLIGRAHTEIVNHANSVNGGLIVAGAQGEHSVLEKLLGSTALRLIKVASCPVLIVKNKNTIPTNYQQVVAAVDFSVGSQEVPALASLIAPNAHIEALLIFDSNQEAHMYKAGMDESLLAKYREQALVEAQKKLDALITLQSNHFFSSLIRSGYPPKEICAHAKEVNADLIVIGKHNKNNLEDWLLGSVTKAVVYGAECDVLLNH
jgi:nucleotide-binding universal stress UspA family protein